MPQLVWVCDMKLALPLSQQPHQIILCPTFLSGHLSRSAKIQLRLAKIFKAAVEVAYDDMFDHPWKMPFYTMPLFGIGSAIMTATIVLHCMGQSRKSKQFKSKITGAFNQAVRYDQYKDCYYMDDRGVVHVSPKDLSFHCTKWLYHQLSNKVRRKVFEMDKGYCKALMYKKLVKRLPRPNVV